MKLKETSFDLLFRVIYLRRNRFFISDNFVKLDYFETLGYFDWLYIDVESILRKIQK